MPEKKSDYVSEEGAKMVDVYAVPDKLAGVQFTHVKAGKPNTGKQVPQSALASDQASFTGEEILFSRNADKFSEDKGLPYNKGDDVGV